MKRFHLVPLALSLGLATAGTAALAQTPTEAPADFGPPPPATELQPQSEAAPTSQPQFELALPQDAPEATQTPPATQFAPAPSAADEAPVIGETRRAAPENPAPAQVRHGDAQTGPYLGHGLFNNSGPNDFGA